MTKTGAITTYPTDKKIIRTTMNNSVYENF